MTNEYGLIKRLVEFETKKPIPENTLFDEIYLFCDEDSDVLFIEDVEEVSEKKYEMTCWYEEDEVVEEHLSSHIGTKKYRITNIKDL